MPSFSSAQPLRFVLCQADDQYQHLALFDLAASHEPVAHWMLPAALPPDNFRRQSNLVLVEVPTRLAPPTTQLDTGLCQPSARWGWPASDDGLLLRLHGTRLNGQFVLLRLRPGGSSWLFGPVQYMPDQFRRGPVVAPPWPRSGAL